MEKRTTLGDGPPLVFTEGAWDAVGEQIARQLEAENRLAQHTRS